MNRLARTGGTAEILRWLAGRAEGWAGLVGPDGRVLHAASRTERAVVPDVAGLMAEAAGALTERGAQTYVLDTGVHTALLFPLSSGDPDSPVLVAVTPRPVAAGLGTLLADVVLPLSLCRQAETLERRRRRVDLAESRGREAVLHLLMTGQLAVAHQVAGALRPRLPDPVRVCVVECAADDRDEVARICADVDGGRSWIVRCPVYSRHLILVMPVRDGDAEGGAMTDEVVAARVGACVVGVSEPAPLADTATGYRQAFHALAVARELPARHARFGVSPDPALVVGPEGRQWADDLLNPLLTHAPRRARDPGSQELLATATSWLAFSSHATDHLKIHRNTLAARLKLVGELLGLDLHRLADQAALDLALRVRATPAPACTPATACAPGPVPYAPEPVPHALDGPGAEGWVRGLDTVLRRPAVRDWAERQLAPVDGSEEILRTWLRCQGRLGPAAAELGLSVPGARKRLARLETVLQRSLLRPPSARYDLWLALRSRDLPSA
ncbi:helix-turn-helix domain-containing protein [Streptomyces californicus]|uniref:helix-turn-helix domain-containing protein n=1 Tax=Streptomyces californicus TaxID=67351 RepID=UPI0004BE561C|nr:helix-turn-helix domain-containing protein [Streptomyces californicus]